MIYRLLFSSRQHQFSESGFGLLSIVFLILTLSISAITVMTLINPSILTRQSKDTVDKAKVLRAAIQSYQFSHGGVSGTKPPTLDDLTITDSVACLVDNDPTHSTYLFLQGWCGPYVDQIFLQNLADFKTDGWGTTFNYDAANAVITSCGPDKSCGGADDLTFAP